MRAEDLIRRLGSASGPERDAALAQLAGSLTPDDVQDALDAGSRASPEVAVRVRRALAIRADLLPGLVEAALASGDPESPAALALSAHYLLHRTPLPEELDTVEVLPSELFRFSAEALTRLEIVDRLNRSGRIAFPIIVSPELARSGTRMFDPAGIMDGATGTVEMLLAALGFPLEPGRLPRPGEGLLLARRDHLLVSVPAPQPPGETLFVRFVLTLSAAERTERDLALTNLACLPLPSLTAVFDRLAEAADPERSRLGELGLAVRAARGVHLRGLPVERALAWVDRSLPPAEPRSAWFLAGAVRAAASLPAPRTAVYAERVKASLAAAPDARARTVWIRAAAPVAGLLAGELVGSATSADPAEAVAALAALGGQAGGPIPAADLAKIVRLLASSAPDPVAEEIGRLLAGRLAPGTSRGLLPDLVAVPPGAASEAAARIIASSDAEGVARVVAALTDAPAVEPRVPGWIRGLRAARVHGWSGDLGTLSASFRRAGPEQAASCAAALVALYEEPPGPGGVGPFRGQEAKAYAALREEVARPRSTEDRVFWARSFGRFLGMAEVLPDRRGPLPAVLELLGSESEELALAGVVAAEACSEVRRELGTDVRIALQQGRLQVSPGIRRLIESRLGFQRGLPDLDLPDLLAER